jgi:hypothetical protein
VRRVRPWPAETPACRHDRRRAGHSRRNTPFRRCPPRTSTGTSPAEPGGSTGHRLSRRRKEKHMRPVTKRALRLHWPVAQRSARARPSNPYTPRHNAADAEISVGRQAIHVFRAARCGRLALPAKQLPHLRPNGPAACRTRVVGPPAPPACQPWPSGAGLPRAVSQRRQRQHGKPLNRNGLTKGEGAPWIGKCGHDRPIVVVFKGANGISDTR